MGRKVVKTLPGIAFGQVLRELRSKRGLTQIRFAELAKFDRSVPHLYERGLRQPTLSSIYAIAKVLHTTPGLLIKEAHERFLFLTTQEEIRKLTGVDRSDTAHLL